MVLGKDTGNQQGSNVPVYKEDTDQHPLLEGSLLTLPIDTLITRRIYALLHHISVRPSVCAYFNAASQENCASPPSLFPRPPATKATYFIFIERAWPSVTSLWKNGRQGSASEPRAIS